MSEYNMIDIDNIPESRIDDLEAKRIEALIVKKISQIRRKNKKGMLIALIACCMILTTFTAFAFSESISDIFNKFFGIDVIHFDNSIYPINKSASQNGLVLTVQGVAGYEKNALVLFEVSREDGLPFTGDYFEPSISLKVDSSGYGTNSGRFKLIDGKFTSSVSLRTMEELRGKDASLKMGSPVYRELILEKASVNLMDYLEQDQNMGQSLVENDKQSAIYRDKYIPRSVYSTALGIYIRDTSLLPKYILTYENFSIPILDIRTDVKLDSIGFVDDQLHIRINYKAADWGDEVFLYMIDHQTGNAAPVQFWTESNNNEAVYYVFDIKDKTELQQYDLFAEYYGEKQTFAGQWQVDFNMEYDYAIQNVNPVIDMQEFEGLLTVDEIQVTPIASTIKLSPVDGFVVEDGFFVGIDIKMKDGTFVDRTGGGGSAFDDSYGYTSYYWPIDVNEIDTIIIKDLEKLGEDEMERWMAKNFPPSIFK